jgi:Lrp/AsnC family leucine-responsive transcriptional regulator
MARLDSIDKSIIRLLQEDAKYTNKQIAERLHLTTTPVFERIKKLEKEGYIEKYVALVNRKKVGLQLISYCDVSLKQHDAEYLNIFEREILSLPEVVECYHIAGMFDYLLKVVVPDMETYQRFVAEKLATFENIGRVQSAFVMKEIKSSTALHLP